MALLLRRAEQNGPRRVAEENAGLPVGPVDKAAERLGPDDQRTPDHARADELVGDGQAVDGAGAGGGHIEAEGVPRAEKVLNIGGAGGSRRVAGDRANDDHVDLLRRDARGRQRLAGGGRCEVGGRLMVARDVALPDSRPADDPVVVRGDDFLEIGIGQSALRRIGTRSENDGIRQSEGLSERRPTARR